MIIKSPIQLRQYQQLAALSTQILDQLRQAIKPGVTPLTIDALAEQLCKQHQVQATFKGVKGKKGPYQHTTCISVNDTVVHGIPNEQAFVKGDLVKVDFGIKNNQLTTDHCFTVGVAELSTADKKLVKTTKKAVQAAVKLAKVGQTTGDLGHAIETMVNQAGFKVIKEFVGHGIGQQLHESPQLPAFGNPGQGETLKPGMVLCIEAQVVAGNGQVYFTDDGWSVKTQDGSKAAMFEYMAVVRKSRPLLLTKTLNWPIITNSS
ncbi:MAG: type I methionyl aminopeptidase [Candidatus Pacebacteria bacterium]|nr:type I methionyl aminopeptidase [Candidatus Paceibacterota bacterium]